MKKFLSLVLALVMTMSLVTISAGATEYKDFTDKDEIQYAEAVTVLNKLGIITGYSEGDFRPQGELTRGAAAKILVSLLIGPDAAEALGNESSPYPDVPAGNTFAGVISYCKTAKIINGYGDGTFRPQGTLTGYAFAKMLLGALGYKSEYEGFTGAGWNMNVARLGGEAGLFDRISFNGNATVTREQACQLALNTLKGTMVEYSGGMNITNGDQSVVVNPDRNYKTSNQEFATHIDNKKASDVTVSSGTPYTVEFGEEHFVDLRMDRERSNADVFGRPSNVWSWKKVTIGTFPVEADFVFTEQKEHKDATDSAKNRATGLGGYDVSTGTATSPASSANTARLWINGVETISGDVYTELTKNNVSAIADLTDNGTTVEVYVDDDTADLITDIVVIKTQLMEVRRVASDYVALQMYDNGNSDDDSKNFDGYNQKAINQRVDNVQAEDDCYNVLSGLKAGDIVVVAPVEDGDSWKVGDAYVPETVSGAITGVVDYGKTNGTPKGAVSVTVGGTEYKIALWNKKLYDITADSIKATKKDVTLYLDKNGNAMLAKDVGATNDWMVIGAFRQALENGRIVNIVTGWDISGTAVELNVGTVDYSSRGFRPGDLAKYTSTTSNVAEWQLSNSDVFDVFTGEDGNTHKDYELKSSNTVIALGNPTPTNKSFDKNVKFIYVNYSEEDGEVESIEVKTTRQNVTNTELKAVCDETDSAFNAAQACVKDNAVKAVVIKGESNEAIASNMLYVRDYYGSAAYDSTNKMVYGYRVAMNTATDFNDDLIIYSYEKLDRGDFASYTAAENADHSEFYTLRRHNDFVNRTTGTYGAVFSNVRDENAGYITLGSYVGVQGDALKEATQVSTAQPSLGIGNEANIINVKDANFLDLRPNSQKTGVGNREISTYDDLKAVMVYRGVTRVTLNVVMIINDNPTNDGFRNASMVVITGEASARIPDSTIDGQVDGRKDLTALSVGTLNASIAGTVATLPDSLATTAESPASVKASVSWTHNGKSATATLAGTVTPAPVSVANGEEVTFKPAESPYTLTITVKDNNGVDKVYTCSITVDAYAKPAYANSTVAGLGLTDGQNGYTANDYKGNDKVSVNDATGELTAPIVLTGDINDTKAQITGALNHLEYTNISFVGVNGSERLIEANDKDGKGVSLKYDEDNAKVLVYVAATEGATAAKYIAAQGKVGTVLNTAFTLTLAENTSSVNGAKLGDPTAVDVVPGATYVTKAFAAIQALPANASVTGDVSAEYYLGTTLDAAHKIAADGKVNSVAGYVKVDDVITVVLKFDNAVNTTGHTGSAMKVAYDVAVDAAPVLSPAVANAMTFDAATKTVTFAAGATDGKTIAQNSTLTATFTIAELASNGQYTCPAITFTAGTP